MVIHIKVLADTDPKSGCGNEPKISRQTNKKQTVLDGEKKKPFPYSLGTDGAEKGSQVLLHPQPDLNSPNFGTLELGDT